VKKPFLMLKSYLENLSTGWSPALLHSKEKAARQRYRAAFVWEISIAGTYLAAP
jgi:hypothetical protein